MYTKTTVYEVVDFDADESYLFDSIESVTEFLRQFGPEDVGWDKRNLWRYEATRYDAFDLPEPEKKYASR